MNPVAHEADDGHALGLQVFQSEPDVEDGLAAGTDDQDAGHAQLLQIRADVHGCFGAAMDAAYAAGGKDLEAQLLPALKDPRSINPIILAGVAAGLFAIYLFFSYCGSLICQKTGNPPGALIWIPVLQLIPLIRAAGMAPIWFIAWLLPVINIVAQVIWAFKIARARNKGAGVGLLLLFPLTSVFAFMYLAFSGGSGKPKEPKPKAPEIMTLEAA